MIFGITYGALSLLAVFVATAVLDEDDPAMRGLLAILMGILWPGFVIIAPLLGLARGIGLIGQRLRR